MAPPQAFILRSQAFALSRDARQLFRETLEFLHNRIIARACRPMRVQDPTKAGTLCLKQFGKLFPEFLWSEVERGPQVGSILSAYWRAHASHFAASLSGGIGPSACHPISHRLNICPDALGATPQGGVTTQPFDLPFKFVATMRFDFFLSAHRRVPFVLTREPPPRELRLSRTNRAISIRSACLFCRRPSRSDIPPSN